MAQVAEGDIKAGSTRIVGRVRVDPGMIRAEGGPLEPRLVIPATLEMHSRPADQMLALVRLEASLHLDNFTNFANQVGPSVTADLTRGMYVRSLPHGVNSNVVDVRFPLSPAAVHRLEYARHAVTDGAFTLYLKLAGTLAWLSKTWGEAQVIPGQQVVVDSTDPFAMQLGLHSSLSILWQTDIDNLRVQVDPSVWLANVLPGFGIDNHRLVEVILPPALPDIGNAAKTFDDALRAYDAKQYELCISKCRGIVSAWNQQLSAGSKRHLADIVGDGERWPADDQRRALLDALWQGLLNSVNVPHHPEAQAGDYAPTQHDSRLHLMLMAVISEYLHGVLR